jgi:outer membrane protein, heavy metal efflux system
VTKQKTVSGVCVALLGVFFLSHLAQGQTVLMLDDAVRQAMDNHPLLRAESQRIATADALVTQAGVRPNPRLFIQSENWRYSTPTQAITSTFTDQFAYLSQVLETGGKRQRRVDVAQQNVQLSQLERELVGKQIEARVKQAYWAAVGAEQVLQLLRTSAENMQQTVEYHEIQLREGAIAEADVIRVRLEGDRVAIAVENAARDAELARIALLREMGVPEILEIRLGETLDAQPEPPAVNIADALAARIDVRQARQAVEQAQTSLRLQNAVAKPDVEVLSGYKRTSGYNTAIWGVQVNLPFFNRNEGNIAAASSEITVAESRLKAAEARVRADVETALRDVQSRRQRLASLLTGSLARSNDSVSVARAAYREGGTDLLRLLDAERIHIELEVMNARMRAEYRQSLVALETALGVSR